MRYSQFNINIFNLFQELLLSQGRDREDELEIIIINLKQK